MKLQKYTLGLLALCASAFMSTAPAHAQSNTTQDSALLDALVKKGVLSDQEAEDISAQEQKAYSSTAASKIQLPSSVKTITFYGDMRLRYELREGTTNSGYTGTGGALGKAGSETFSRWRYRLRFGAKGDLYDNFFWGLRLSSNPYYDRSGNVNFGASDSGGEFGKARNILALDQVFLGWKATPDITLIGGQMANPLYTTNMIWDDNLNPTGAAEKYDHTFDNGIEVFANAGQFVYGASNGNGIVDNIGSGVDASTIFMFAEQAGFKYSFDKDTFFKMAIGGYTYSGTNNGGAPGNITALYSNNPNNLQGAGQSPSFFNGPFVGAASAGPNGLLSSGAATSTTPATPGSSNVSGINDLAVIEVPMEYDFKIGPGVHKTTSGDPKDAKATVTETQTGWSLPVRVFADFAYNVDAADRAGQARSALNILKNTSSTGSASVAGNGFLVPGQSNANILASPGYQGVLHSGTGFLDQIAYQVGTEVGGLKKKGDWDGKLYWQSTGYYAVDPNLIDADIFNAATNMQGVVVSVSHNWTDGLSSTLRYAYGMKVNGLLATPNVGQDLTLGNINTYNLFQADLMWKF